MKFKIESEVIIEGIGKTKYTHIQDFADDSNVFGRAYEYRQYMRKMFPDCKFKLVKATEL